MKQIKSTEQYILSDELRYAVEISITLGRPLLVKGEPGTGKTQLAKAISHNLEMEMLTWNIKSTTKAKEGLYHYDTVKRLHDSRFGDGEVSDIKKYIRLGKLGQAFNSDTQVLLLVDEIDKADLEFPNDLLNELDEMYFHIPETEEVIRAKKRPVVIITSNSEKELPDAFLRRCVFHYINFPKPEEMVQIVKLHHPGVEDKLLKAAMVKFYWLRDLEELRKKPSTSEFLDWIQALARGGVNTKKLEEEIPYIGTLLKKEQDLAVVEKSAKAGPKVQHGGGRVVW